VARIYGRPAKKGERPGGRAKGTPNKVTRELKVMIEVALENAGGVEYLQRVAKKNPAAFLALVGKLLPKDINLKTPGGLIISVGIGDEARRAAKA